MYHPWGGKYRHLRNGRWGLATPLQIYLKQIYAMNAGVIRNSIQIIKF